MNDTNNIIEQLLSKYRDHLGADFEKYRNHVYRVYVICTRLDPITENKDKYAIAAVFHDLGIWVNDTFDYLEPSILLAKEYLKASKNIEWSDEIEIMIDMHHKRSKYTGRHSEIVEIFRKADWIDVTMGRKSYGYHKKMYKKLSKEYPFLGFHRFLVIQTIKNLFKSPLNPLPMFKK